VRTLALLALLSLTVQDDDVAKRVRALVEQLGSDDLEAGDAAAADLIKLGAKALPELKVRLEKASGDVKLKIEAAVQKIEREARRQRAMGAPVVVSVKAEKRPLAEVLEEMRKSSGQPLLFKELPADPVTVALDATPFWQALDAVCKAHGGAMWRVVGREIRVEKKPYRDVPKVYRGNLVFLFDRMTATTYTQGGASLQIEGAVAWTKGSRPEQATLEVEALEDDKGTKLKQEQGAFGGVFVLSEPGGEEAAVDAERLSDPITFYDSVMPHEDAEALAVFKGTVKVLYALERRRVVKIAGPASAAGQEHPAGELKVKLEDFKVDGATATARILVSKPGEHESVGVRGSDFVLVDSTGKEHVGRGSANQWGWDDGGGGTVTTASMTVTFTIPEKAEIGSLEMSAVVDKEEIELPFDFKKVGIK
jgi:hypothetical protein